jgi:hypothetical protein
MFELTIRFCQRPACGAGRSRPDLTDANIKVYAREPDRLPAWCGPELPQEWSGTMRAFDRRSDGMEGVEFL